MMHSDRYLPLMIHQTFLQHGHYYAGKCRNAYIARWDEPTHRFYHWRDKFGRVFVEQIEYWDPEGTFDGFIPLFDLGLNPPEAIDLPVVKDPSKEDPQNP